MPFLSLNITRMTVITTITLITAMFKMIVVTIKPMFKNNTKTTVIMKLTILLLYLFIHLSKNEQFIEVPKSQVIMVIITFN